MRWNVASDELATGAKPGMVPGSQRELTRPAGRGKPNRDSPAAPVGTDTQVPFAVFARDSYTTGLTA